MASVAKEMICCHYSVQPYRDAFHGRNRPHYLLCYSFLLLFALSHIWFMYMFRSSCDSCKIIDDLFSFTQINRTTILTDTKKIYPTNLTLSIQPYKITSNKPFPICFAAPQFLMPLLQTKSMDNIGNCTDTSSKKDWLKLPSFFGGNNNENNDNKCKTIEFDIDDPFANMRSEDLWQSVLGYQLDPQCIIRIDTSANAILKKMENANIEPSQTHQMLCNIKNNAHSVMKPSYVVINPDNGMIYMNTLKNGINSALGINSECYAFQNTLNYTKMDANKFKTLLETNENIQKLLDGWSGWMFWFLLFLIGFLFIFDIGCMCYDLVCALFEGFIATIIVWIIMIVLKCFGTFKEFDNVSPTFKQIWRINLLICVPYFTFVRLTEVTSIGFYSMVAARVVLTLLLIIDVYKYDRPNIRAV
eukprot:118522_1